VHGTRHCSQASSYKIIIDLALAHSGDAKEGEGATQVMNNVEKRGDRMVGSETLRRNCRVGQRENFEGPNPSCVLSRLPPGGSGLLDKPDIDTLAVSLVSATIR